MMIMKIGIMILESWGKNWQGLEPGDHVPRLQSYHFVVVPDAFFFRWSV